MPRVTVLMPAHNAQDFVGQAIESVLGQSFGDIEFLIFDDCSADQTGRIIASYSDPRIRQIRNPRNLGVAETLNLGLAMAKGEYVARMDADDMCLPRRLEKQVAYMDGQPRTGISGTWIRYFGDQLPAVARSPADSEVIKAYLLFDNPLFHPTVMLRRSSLSQHGLRYDARFHRTEDFDLWSRAAQHVALGNIPEPLLRFRCHGRSVTATAAADMERQAAAIVRRSLAHIGMTEVSAEEMTFHRRIGKGMRMETAGLLRQAEIWLAQLCRKNQEAGYCAADAFQAAAGMIWFRLCRNSAQLGSDAWNICRHSVLAKSHVPSGPEKARFLLSAWYHLLRQRSV